MQQTEFKNLVKQAFQKRFVIFDGKAHDYATEDCLSNFKRVAQLISLMKIDTTTPEGVALFDAVMKMDRLSNLISKGVAPKNESLDDTMNDLQNYIDLLRGVLADKEKGNGIVR